jgi:hypothetical protein
MATTEFTPKALATLDRQTSATRRAAKKLRRETLAKYESMEARLLDDLAQVLKVLKAIPKASVPRQQ